MYLNDLLDALSRGEEPDLAKPELLSIFRAQKHLDVYQRVALFYKLDLRDWGETQGQVATRIGVSRENIKQHEGVMNWTNAENYSHILDALCAGALYTGGKRISTTTLYNKLRNGDRIESITSEGNRSCIEFSSHNLSF